MKENVNQNALNWPNLKFYKHQIYGDNVGRKMMYDIVFEEDDPRFQQYLKLLMRLLNYVELELKKETPNTAGYSYVLLKLGEYTQSNPFFKECKEMGIDLNEAILYILNRARKRDFQYPLTVMSGDNISFIEPMYDLKDGVACFSYEMTPGEAETHRQKIRKLDVDDLAADRSFMDIFVDNNA